MDNAREIREFLATRRARITPQQAGLPAWGGNRRVPGLRREEVAMLAGVSVDYYVRLERGTLGGASESMLNAVADALQLDEAERMHLDSYENPTRPVNVPRFVFCDSRARSFFADWPTAAHDMVAALRI